MCRVNDKVYVTGYKHGEFSRVYMYDSTTGEYEGYIILDNDAHVGGTTYDQEHDILFVTGNDGKVNAYDNTAISDIVESYRESGNTPVVIDINTMTDPNLEQDNAIIINTDNIDISKFGGAATTYYYNGKLYVSTFVGNNNGTMQIYDINYSIDEEGFKHLNPEKIKEMVMPTQVQGIAITDYNGTRYLLVTQSMASNPSNVLVYTIDDDDNIKFLGKKYFRSGLEGIDVDSDGNISIVSEFGDQEVIYTTMDELLNNFDRNRPFAEAGSFISSAAWQHDLMGDINELKRKASEGMDESGAIISQYGADAWIYAGGVYLYNLGEGTVPFLADVGATIGDVVSEPFKMAGDELSKAWDENNVNERLDQANMTMAIGMLDVCATVVEGGWGSVPGALYGYATGELADGIAEGASAVGDFIGDVATDAACGMYDVADELGIVDTAADIAYFIASIWPF